MQLARTLATLALPTLLFACGGSFGSESPAGATPSQVTQQFLDAVQREDEAAFGELLTEAALVGLESGDGFALSGAQLTSFEVGAESVRGAKAEVAVTAVDEGAEQDLHMLLRRGAAGWRVYGMRAQIGDGSITIDLEQTAGLMGAIGEQLGAQVADGMQQAFDDLQNTWEQGGTPEEIAAERASFEALTAVTVEEHDAAWQLDVAGDGRAAADVLEELIAAAGFSLPREAHPEALAQSIELELTGVSRIEAVERVAAAAGLHPVWPADESQPLAFAAGLRALPVAFAGPFMIEVTAVTENAPQPTGSLAVAVYALGLAPAVLGFQTEMCEVLTLERVRAAGDQPLADEAMSHMGTPQVLGGYFRYSLEEELTGLLRGVEAIEQITGSVQIHIPARIETLAIEQEDTAPRDVKLGRLTVANWGESIDLRLDGEEEALEGVVIRTAPRKADGAPLGVQYGSSNGWGRQVQASLQCPEAPAAVDLKVCSVEVVSYPFTLSPVPLTRFSEQPEHLEPLTFDGVAPLSLKLVGPIRREDGQAQVTVSLENRSNKDATTVLVDFRYSGADGSELESMWHTLTGEYDFEAGGYAPVVAAGATVELDTQAAFAPPSTASIRFDLVKAEFPDGTVWEAEQD